MTTTALTTLVGGVGELFQGDLDLGRVVVERLAEVELPGGTVLEELHYGAIAVAQRLEELGPDALVLVGAKVRGGAPGSIRRRVVGDLDLDVAAVQRSVSDAGVGYVDLDLVVDVAWGLQVLPGRTVVIEVEPADTGPGEGLSEPVGAVLPDVVARVRAEVERVGLFDLVARVRPRLGPGVLGPSDVRDALRGLVAALDELDQRVQAEQGWDRTFVACDQLRRAISDGHTSERMDHADWGMTWGLLEEVERLTRRAIERDG